MALVVLAVATPIFVIAGVRIRGMSAEEVWKNFHRRQTRIGAALAAVAFLAILVFGLARL